MSMILLEPAYKISPSEIKRRTISVIPIHQRFDAGTSSTPGDTAIALASK
jgi:hypothetical protein